MQMALMWFTIFSLISFIIIDRLKRRPVWTETKNKFDNVGSDRPDRTVNRNPDDTSGESNDRRDSSVDDDPNKQDKNMRFESSVNQPVQVNAAPTSVQQVTTFQQWNTTALPPKPFEPSMDVTVLVNRFTLYLNTAKVKTHKVSIKQINNKRITKIKGKRMKKRANVRVETPTSKMIFNFSHSV